jgi:hypothetical protein
MDITAMVNASMECEEVRWSSRGGFSLLRSTLLVQAGNV